MAQGYSLFHYGTLINHLGLLIYHSYIISI
nr:MAG TPA: hypothetical protein [Caudoviricetes sp.]